MHAKNFSKQHKIIFFLVVVSLATEAISMYCSHAKLNTTVLFRIYTLLEFSILTGYFIAVTTNEKLKVAMKIILALFGVVALLDAVFQGIMSMDNYSVAIESLILIVYCVFAMFQLMKELQYVNILSAFRFWIVIGVLIYFAGNLFIFVFSNYLLRESPDTFNHLWGIHSVVNIIYHTLIAYAFWKTKPRLK